MKLEPQNKQAFGLINSPYLAKSVNQDPENLTGGAWGIDLVNLRLYSHIFI